MKKLPVIRHIRALVLWVLSWREFFVVNAYGLTKERIDLLYDIWHGDK